MKYMIKNLAAVGTLVGLETNKCANCIGRRKWVTAYLDRLVGKAT